VSLPPSAAITSSAEVPASRLAPAVPTIVAVRPLQVGGGGPGVGGVGGVVVVTPLPVSAAVQLSHPVVRVPALGPVLVGVKVALMMQLTPAVENVDSVAGQSFVCWKSPNVAMLGEKVNGWLRITQRLNPESLLHAAVNVKACGGLVVPTWRLPKSVLVGLRVTNALAPAAMAPKSTTQRLSVRMPRRKLFRFKGRFPSTRSPSGRTRSLVRPFPVTQAAVCQPRCLNGSQTGVRRSSEPPGPLSSVRNPCKPVKKNDPPKRAVRRVAPQRGKGWRCFRRCSAPAADTETSAPRPGARCLAMKPRSVASSQTGSRGQEVRHASSTSA
jgi:hypothetical protein